VDIDTVTEFVPARGVAWREGDAWLGGGTWLFSQPQPALRWLLDLTDFGWRPLTEARRGLEIAATCTLAELARWRPARDWPAASLARQSGNIATRCSAPSRCRMSPPWAATSACRCAGMSSTKA
jgi:hypothetical protein